MHWVAGSQVPSTARDPRLVERQATLLASRLGVATPVEAHPPGRRGAARLAAAGGRSGTRETGVSANEVHEEWEAGVAGLDSVGAAPETAKPLIARREPGGESVGG